MSIPTPSDLRISTHTATCNINSFINVKMIAYFLEIGDGIIYLEYGNIKKGVNVKQMSKKAKEKKKVFFNQITIHVEHSPEKINNLKLFNNGAVSMTGLKTQEEGLKSIKIILEKIKRIEGILYEPMEDVCFRNKIHIEDIKTKDFKCNFCNSNYSYNTVYKLECNHIICNLCKKKNNSTCNECGKNMTSSAVINKSICKIKDYDIVLINSDYHIGFEIKRVELHKLLTEKYNIFSSYEPCIYPGVNSKFFWNENNSKDSIGICNCDVYCNGKGDGKGNGRCKKITISVFQSGSVIITGARSMQQIHDAYNFINKIFKDNYDIVKKTTANFIQDEEVKSKTNNSSKKKQIKIKKDLILNYPSEAIVKKLINMM